MIIIYIFILTVIDILTKYMFYDKWMLSNFFMPIVNKGISYNMFSGQTIPIILASIIVLLFLAYLYIYHKSISKISFILILAGWLGNLFDRIVYGHVRDFLYIWDRFAVFNIADVFIFLWCVMIFWEYWKNPGINDHISN